MKASADDYLHFWVFLGLNPFLQEMNHSSWYFSEPASKHFSSSKLYHNLKLWVHVFHHLWNFLHVFYCQKEFNGNLDGKDFPPQKFWWHFSKVKKYSLVIFLKHRFWPTKIELEAYSSTFLHHGMDYLNSMREKPWELFSTVLLPASRQYLALVLEWFGLWIHLTLSIYSISVGFQEIKDLNTVPDQNSCRFVPTSLHRFLLLGGLLKVFSVFSSYNKSKSVYYFLSKIPWHKCINPVLWARLLRR